MTQPSRSTPAGSRPSSTTRSRPYAGEAAEGAEDQGERQRVTVEVGGRRLEVVLPAGLALGGGGGGAAKKKAPKRSGGSKAGAAASGDSLTAPMQGTIVKVGVEEGAGGRRG